MKVKIEEGQEMTIRIPDSLRDTKINIGVEIPQPEISIEKNKDGSMSLSAHYDMCDISEFAWCVAKELNDDIEKAFIEDLLELNGYIKDRTCTFSKHEKAGDPYPTCSACGYETDWHECEWYFDDTFEYKKNFCPNCGSKVIRNAD